MFYFYVIALFFSEGCFSAEISARILTPTENVDNLVGDFFGAYRSTMPVALLVDATKEAHEAAADFYRDVNRIGLNTITTEFFLVKFNNTGTSTFLASSQKSRLIFEMLLKWSEETMSQTVGFDNSKGSALFFSILQATYQLPYNSGILVFTGRPALDEDLATLALQEATKKRIRLFVIWNGAYSTGKNEERIIKEAALRSGGAFFTNRVSNFNRAYTDSIDATKTKAVILFKKNLRGVQQLHFPVDSAVNGLHVSASGSVKMAILTSPDGLTADILNQTDLERSWPNSFVITDLATHEVSIATHGVVGVWRLDVTDAGQKRYNVTVSVQTDLKTNAGFAEKDANTNKRFIKVEFSDDITKVNTVTFVDENGETLIDNVDFTVSKTQNQDLTDDVETIETDNTNELNIEAEEIPDRPFYILVNGKDGRGNDFTRLSYFNANNAVFTLPAMTVEVGLGSELLAAPNQYAQIFFEVTNNRDQTVFVRFRCQDEKSLLVRMLPISSWLNPRQTVIVTVTTRAQSSNVRIRDLITFTATGPEQVEKSVIMNVDNEKIVDYDEPDLTHRYTSDCMNVLLGSCEDGTWTIEVTAQDTGSGLLQVTSVPSGLYFPNGYTSGTTEKVTGNYGGSCCQSKLQISATDRLGNRKSYTADAYYSYLSAGSIAAIVLGVILLILLIIAIIFLCRYCCKKRDSVDLPTYRGPSSRRT